MITKAFSRNLKHFLNLFSSCFFTGSIQVSAIVSITFISYLLPVISNKLVHNGYATMILFPVKKDSVSEDNRLKSTKEFHKVISCYYTMIKL